MLSNTNAIENSKAPISSQFLLTRTQNKLQVTDSTQGEAELGLKSTRNKKRFQEVKCTTSPGRKQFQTSQHRSFFMDLLYGHDYIVTVSLCLLILCSLTVLNDAKLEKNVDIYSGRSDAEGQKKEELIRTITVEISARR